jgi:site-specific recombinase XerD
LIPHPHIDERVIQAVSEAEMVNLLMVTDPARARDRGDEFRKYRDRAVLFMLWDTPARKGEMAALTVEAVD